VRIKRGMMTQKYDPFLLFAEQNGVYLSPRELRFCNSVLNNKSSKQAFSDAEIPDSEGTAESIYLELREVIEGWRESQELDYKNSLDVYRRAQGAQTVAVVKIVEDAEGKAVRTYGDADNHGVQISGTKGLCDMLGFKAPEKSELTITPGELPEDIKEMLKSVRNQAGSK
jgi:hypothetical protein